MVINDNEKIICRIVDFAVLADHNVKIKEGKKKENYLDLAWELKKLWNMKVKGISIIFRALEMIPEGLIRRLEDLEIGRAEKSPGNLRRFAAAQNPM